MATTRLDRDQFDAALFDLDGVLTATASVHAEAWKTLFDHYLEHHSKRLQQPFVPFEVATDYLEHVDGKPRLDGIRDFLDSRGIHLPEGSADDPAEAETVHGLGRKKNQMVLDAIRQGRVKVYDGSVALLKHLRNRGLKLAVVSSSRNCQAVLAAAGLQPFFETIIDGQMAAEMGLEGKPAPDTFQEAARLLGVAPARAIVFEDATAGCQAARSGGFGLVVGVDRADHAHALEAAGADLVVSDLSALVD